MKGQRRTMTRKPAHWLIAVAAAFTGLFAVPGTASAVDPSVALDQQTTMIGDTVDVRLSGWPAGVVTAALCGNEARDGSADCALQSAASASVPRGGKTELRVRVAAPPLGCPCVIRAATVTGDRIVSVPIDVTDVPDAAVVSPGRDSAGRAVKLVVTDADVKDRWSLGSLFGGTAHRTLLVSVLNDGSTASPGAELSLDLGRAAGARAPAAVPIGPLAPGAELRLEIPFEVAAPAIGRYQLTGRVDGTAGSGTTFTARTVVWPWLLPLVPGALFLILAFARRAARAARAMSPLHAGGAGLIGAGAFCAAVLAAQTLLPGPETADAQAALDSQLSAAWGTATRSAEPGGAAVTSLDAPATSPPQGQPFAVLHVPRWSAHYTVVEGVSTADLRKGPGHYPGSALPGQIGNMAVAGHRGPNGLPFNDIDEMLPGDPIVVETATAWYVYRVQRHLIVAPSRVDVVAPTPERTDVEPTVAMLTLTACHPRFSSKQRYILFSQLDEVLPKATTPRPAVLGN